MHRLRALTTGTLLLATGCSVSPTEPASVVGTYHLQFVNGNPLPATIALLDLYTRSEVTEGILDFTADGTYSLDFSFRNREHGVVVEEYTESSNGTYRVSGSMVIFTDDMDGTFFGTGRGNELVIADGGFALVFRR